MIQAQAVRQLEMRRQRVFRSLVAGLIALLGVCFLTKYKGVLLPCDMLRKNRSCGNCQEDNNTDMISLTSRLETKTRPRSVVQIHVAVAVCKDRMPEALTMLKSAAALTRNASLIFHIFAEKRLQEGLSKQLQAWPKPYSEMTKYRLYDVTLPPDQNATWWTKVVFWQPCANQRLFLPSLLPDVDAVMYMDTDTVFLTSLLPVWNTFSSFTSSQMMGMVAEDENKKGAGWYITVASIPYIPPSGVNSGVVLMNLTRLRHSNWSRDVLNYSRVYRRKLILIDQDLFNIYLHFHPEHLFWLDCSLNYRTDHCMKRHVDPSSACISAERQGVQILHGSRQIFHRQGSFRHVYNAFVEYQLGEDLRTHLLDKVRHYLRKDRTTPCTSVNHAFTMRLAETVKNIASLDNHSMMTTR